MSGFDMTRLPFLMMSAAELIETNAQSLKEAHTLPDGDWGGDANALEHYEREMVVADDLKQAAKELAGITSLMIVKGEDQSAERCSFEFINPDKEKAAIKNAKRLGFIKERDDG